MNKLQEQQRIAIVLPVHPVKPVEVDELNTVRKNTYESFDQYEDIGDKYNKAKQVEWRKVLEEYTLFEVLLKDFDIKDKTVLDFACGDGHYSRRYAKKGCGKITAIDQSSEMIKLAEQWSIAYKNIEYFVGDVLNYQPEVRYDIVSAVYLQNYAQNEEELENFISKIRDCLKSGAIFVGFNCNPMQKIQNFNKTKHNLVTKSTKEEEYRNGLAVKFHFWNAEGDQICQVENYWLPKKLHEELFQKYGMKLEWIYPQLSPKHNISEDIYVDFLEDPPVIGIKATLVNKD